LEETDSFIHARFVTPFWGFADDFYVQLFCQSNGTVAVWVQVFNNKNGFYVSHSLGRSSIRNW
jgi:hypothetical protein